MSKRNFYTRKESSLFTPWSWTCRHIRTGPLSQVEERESVCVWGGGGGGGGDVPDTVQQN